MATHPITPCLWFNNQAEEAANFYVSIFVNSKIGDILYYGKEGFEVHGMPEGTVMTVDFNLNGQPYTALNGGPVFTFNEAISLQVICDTQEEIDYYWDKLTEGGEEIQCGWLKDKFGVSWQVTPVILQQLLLDPEKAERVTKVFLKMKKYDIETLRNA
ncbi:MAG TPA: VOC family protein [Saprospiraceae bacterium]|nr:VOC family protein [Saprospiraceae bacterium]